MNINIQIVRDDATELLNRIGRVLGSDRTRANRYAAERVESCVRDHLTQISLTRHATAEKLGASPTGFWKFGAGATETGIQSSATERSATITITHPGISRVSQAVTIRPTHGKFLAIPIHQISYGVLARDLRDHGGIQTFIPKGKNIIAMKSPDGKGIIPLYVLLASVTLPQDRTLLPADETLQDQAVTGIRSFLTKLLGESQNP